MFKSKVVIVCSFPRPSGQIYDFFLEAQAVILESRGISGRFLEPLSVVLKKGRSPPPKVSMNVYMTLNMVGTSR